MKQRSKKIKIKKVNHEHNVKKEKIVKKIKKVRKKADNPDKKIDSGKIIKILNLSHPDDLYITLKLLSEAEASKLLTYFRKNRSRLHKKKELTKLISDSKNRTELLTNVKTYLTNNLKKEYEELKQQTSILRKKGTDMLIEDLKLMKIPSKIRLFEATEDKKDFFSVKQMIDKIRQEIEIKKN